MASPQSRLNQRALAALDVALRVPCIFIIDAILNSYSEPGAGWAGTAGRLSVRAVGVLVSLVILLLSQKALFRFYSLFLGVLLAFASVLVNYYAASHSDFHGVLHSSASALRLLPRAGAAVWLALAAVQLAFGIGFICLLRVHSLLAALIVLDVVMPLWALMLELPVDVRQLVAVFSGLALALTTLFCLAVRLRWFYYSCRYVYLLVRHMYRIYGLQLLLEDTWKRIRFPDVLRVFWLTRVTAQALLLIYVIRAVSREGHEPAGGTTDTTAQTQAGMLSWEGLGELLSNLIISGCDSTLTVLGMSAVISSVAHYLGLSILAFIGSTEEEDKRLGFVAPVLFFILALQTGLSSLDPEERLVRLSRNMCLLLTAILHFVHGMADPVLMSLSASHVSSLRRHLPVLLVSIALLVLPVLLSLLLWKHYALNTWLFAVTAFCVELCLKVMVSLTVYGLFMADGLSVTLWEKLDDYVYYVRSTGNIIEFLFGVVMFGNGAYTMMFESGSKIRACMMCLHAYFNIYLQAKNGWRTFINRRSAVKKINSLPELKGAQLHNIGDVCAICYQEFSASARITPCNHYFHALCLRKWLYIQDTCPMCHQRVYIEDSTDRAAFTNNNGAAVYEDAEREREEGAEEERPEERREGAAEEDRGEINDNDSIEYDSDEWGTQNTAASPEEEYMDQDSDSDQN
ncbi:E3 ubiquitin-protein ligase RNF139 [Boleophthalmus pectinirostris]|uniref:E3 ubiquitin-protein ligase RNF139 n=1 Tax=Boleophthalmus pectinirostris TaxID=150288 RepID=UPI00242AA5DF|nr:E3 ubiquitin-protein ligase RNF139 [Boleophthalmus pectinirostris]